MAALVPTQRMIRTAIHPNYIRYSNKIVKFDDDVIVPPSVPSSALELVRKDEFIDAEIVGEEGSIQRTGDSNGSSSSRDFKKRNKLVEGVLSLFGQDEASKKKKERNQKMNSMIDQAFEGTGLLGGGVKNIFKAVAAPLADAMAESMGDMELVQAAVIDALERRSDVVSYLGSDIRLGAAMQSMSSSVNINGNLSKQMSLVIPVSGRRGNGVVQVGASVSGGRANVNKCILQTNDGRVVNVGEGEGGGVSGGSGTVIDAEIV